MLTDKRVRKIVDFPDATDCFAGVDISGGVCYFLWNRDSEGDCEVINMRGQEIRSTMIRSLLEKGCDTFIRFNEAVPILRKIAQRNEATFATLVSPQTPFGIISSFRGYKREPFQGAIKIYTAQGVGYISEDVVVRNKQWVSDWKVYIAKAYGERGEYPYRYLAKPFLGEPNSCCTQAYLLIGPFSSKEECQNVMSYIKTRFFRFCVMLKKNSQDAMRDKYTFVPMQDFSKSWTDEELYQKYGLTTEEIAFIESMIRPMDNGGSEATNGGAGDE